MNKSFSVEQVDLLGEAGSGKFEALVSVFDNVDAVKDVVMRPAFDRAIKEQDPPPVVWSHFWNIPPIGDMIDWDAKGAGLRVQGQLFVGADDKHQYADMVYAAMKSRDGRKPALREFSFSYDITDARQGTRELDGKSVQVQEIHEFFPVHEVGPCLKGCNPATQLISAPKAAWREDLQTLITKGVITKDELLAMFPDDPEDDDVRQGAYPAEVTELLLAFPNH